MLVSNQEFVTKLTSLFTTSSDKHSIYITSKRAPSKALPTPSPSSVTSTSHALLYKATNGVTGSGKIKFRTLVLPPDLVGFQTLYLSSLRSSLSTSLKKRDKAKERKAEKVKEAARKRVTSTTTTTTTGAEEGGAGVAQRERLITNKVGSKRGAGRRKRQRALKKGVEIRKEMRKETRRKKKAATAAGGGRDADGDVKMASA